MKRPPGLWILLSAGVLWLSLQDVYGIRATALIFAKTTTSTTTAEPSSVSPESADEETVGITEISGTTGNSTNNQTLTGVPQIDYVWDPNLPKELNGYNLSEYPFYERVPEDIDFKCDGLHDGFYASVPHKCQVYHHCLFGTRYDFLCANYTAFDQKTFICHFVSEVDCQNSKKFWHRNDALYTATTTTTQKPLRRDIYTPPPQPGDPVTPLPSGAAAPRGAPEGRRPYRPNRRRPQFDYYEDDYYDDYYEDRPRRNRGRKRPRPRRPVYEDDYEDYEDERYERRGSGRRRPYRRRNKERRKPEYEDEEEVEERFEDEDFIAANKRHRNEDRRKHAEDDIEEPERERKRTKTEKRRHPESSDDTDERKATRKGSRKPSTSDEYGDELSESDDSRSYEGRTRKDNRKKQDKEMDGRPVIKPVSGSIYDRPRLAPRINLPVPKNVADKFSYKSSGASKSSTTAVSENPEDDNYEDYEEEVVPQKNKNQETKSDERKNNTENDNKSNDSRGQAASTSKQKVRKPDNENSTEKTTVKPKYGTGRTNKYSPNRHISSSTKKPAIEEYDDEYEYEIKDIKNNKKEKPSTTTTSTSTTTTEASLAKERPEHIVRVVKRPFLPSRGGNPYSARGLQPVGLKAGDKKTVENEDANEQPEKPVYEPEERKTAFKPSPIIIKVPIRSKYIPPSAEAQEVFDSESSRQQNYRKEFPALRTTEKTPKIPEKNPLDLNEYDVTLNDALSPTLPNVPVRGYPTGFSSGNDYSYSTYQRPRYVADPVLSSSDSGVVYQNPATRQQPNYERVAQNQYINGGYRRRDVPNGQTQAIYSSY